MGYSLYAELKTRVGGGGVRGVGWGGVGSGWVGGKEGWRELGGQGGGQKAETLGSLVVLEALVEEEVGRQVLVLLAGKVGLDHQGLREAQRF